jgi:predicted RNA-binding Zn-ribbon protein involved in translation (DUF1610 family)
MRTMANPRACPICRGAEMVRREGKLDQSGNTYLPTVVQSCPVCGYTKFAPAVGARWKSEVEVAQTSSAGERKAA